MKIIEIQCGHCNQMMAVSAEHLGTEVSCPHCQAVVRAPIADTLDLPGEPAPMDVPPRPEEHESIFTAPERDSLFDGEDAQAPRIEMPELAAPPVPKLSLDDSASQVTAAAPAPAPVSEPSSGAGMPDLGLHDAEPTRLPMPRRRSLLIPTLLLFLVPYSIVSTVFWIILWGQVSKQNNNPNTIDPMERIPDPETNPKDKKGPPRKVTRVSHDTAVPRHLVTKLKRPVRIGDVEVTPLEIHKTDAGDLAMRLRVKNLAADHAFVPVSKVFLEVSDQEEIGKPYCFLQAQGKPATPRVYGGFLEYQTTDGEPDLASGGELLPSKDGVLQITTLAKYRSNLNRVLDAGTRLLWRVQVRRGLVEVKGSDEPRSATAVIGVDFAEPDVIRSAVAPDDP